MVEKIIVNPESVRGLGNIAMEKSVTDFEMHYSSIIESKILVNGVQLTGYTMDYSVYGVSFGFDENNNQLYVTSDEGYITGFNFDPNQKRFVLSDDQGVVVDFSFDNVNKRMNMQVE